MSDLSLRMSESSQVKVCKHFNFILKYFADEGLYAQPDMRGMTLKREYRDELGYIAPPNRKLPPVPGSNYSTCDRIKKGGYIGLHSTY